MISNANVYILCKCLDLTKGRCSNCKARCFTLNFIAAKIQVASLLDVPGNVQLKKINEYLEMLLKICFSYKIYCGLDNKFVL